MPNRLTESVLISDKVNNSVKPLKSVYFHRMPKFDAKIRKTHDHFYNYSHIPAFVKLKTWTIFDLFIDANGGMGFYQLFHFPLSPQIPEKNINFS